MVGINQIAAQRPQSRQSAILIRAGEPAVADHIRRKDRREFPGLGHGVPSGHNSRLAQRPVQNWPEQKLRATENVSLWP